MKTLFGFAVIVLGILLAGLLTVGLSVLTATGIGWLLTKILPFSLFEATLLSLIALPVPLYLGLQIIKSIASAVNPEESDWDEDEWDEDEEEEGKEEYTPAIPRWRQPIKRTDRFANVDPDERCPCGSGKKYKNCHGRNKV